MGVSYERGTPVRTRQLESRTEPGPTTLVGQNRQYQSLGRRELEREKCQQLREKHHQFHNTIRVKGYAGGCCGSGLGRTVIDVDALVVHLAVVEAVVEVLARRAVVPARVYEPQMRRACSGTCARQESTLPGHLRLEVDH